MPTSRSILAAVVTAFIAAAPLSAFQYPLSETVSRSAYFLGQRRGETVGQFLDRYSQHLPPPKTGPYVSDISFLTPYAQLVRYSSRQGIYSAQQAELDGPRTLSTVEIAVYIYFANPSSFPLSWTAQPSSRDSGQDRSVDLWRSYTVRVLDGKELRQPSYVSGQSQSRCASRSGCIRVGTAIFLSLPAEIFSSDIATIEVTTPDGQVISAEFDLNSLR